MEGGSVLRQRHHPSERRQILKRRRGGCSSSSFGPKAGLEPATLCLSAQPPTGRDTAESVVSLSLSHSLSRTLGSDSCIICTCKQSHHATLAAVGRVHLQKNHL